jgi:hypothetical protein
MIREGTWPMTKSFRLILFVQICDEIDWMRDLLQWEKDRDDLRKTLSRFDWDAALMWFIELVLFHDKRKNLTIYEKLMVDFIDTELWWHLLNGSFFTIWERIWPFTNSTRSFLLIRYLKTLIESKSDRITEKTGPSMKCLRSILLATSRDEIYWMRTLPW